MLDLRYPDWETEYFAALLEPDPERSVERVAVAEATLIDRLRDIAGDHAYDLECEAIRGALINLQMIQPRDWTSPTLSATRPQDKSEIS